MKKHILIFKTSINTNEDKKCIAELINEVTGASSWTVDLEDCDKVLRVCAGSDISKKIINTLSKKGYLCEVMDW